jgi:hypothetical protein
MLLLYAIAIGLLVGLVTGGRVSALSGQRVKWWPVALGGLFFQLVLFSPTVAEVVGDAGPLLYVGSTGMVLVALAVNVRLPGFWLIGLGAVLNLTAIVANGGYMPASPEALAALSGVAALPTDAYSNSAVAGAHTTFALLGDIFYLPRPFPMANVFSIGDVLIGIGGALFVARTMHRSRPGPELKPSAQIAVASG